MRLLKILTLMLVMAGMNMGFVHAERKADTGIIRIQNEAAGHEFRAYEIFSGTVDRNSKVMTNMTWGKGVKSEFIQGKDPVAYAKKLEQNKNQPTAYDELSDNLSDTFIESRYDKDTGDYLIENLPNGYFLIVDEAKGEKKDTSKYMVANICSCEIDITPKHDEPSVVKKVKENVNPVYYDEDGTMTKSYVGEKYNDVADYSRNDHVPFELIGTIPTTLDYFTSYKYIFHDTLSKGLTFDEGSLTVKLFDSDGNEMDDLTETFKSKNEGQNVTVSCDDIKKIDELMEAMENVKDQKAGPTIRVFYTATLNNQAVIGLAGNPNEVYLEYSNNPNKKGEGSTGQTPKDQVVVFTYGLEGTKIDHATQSPLANAKFKLYRGTKNKEYAVVENGKVTAWNKTGTELVSDAQGQFKAEGLDAGKYYLEETVAPDGYNKLTDPVEFIIVADTKNDQQYDGEAANALRSLSITINGQKTAGDTATGLVKATVANTSSVQLPEAGKRGTLVFSILGMLMMGGGAMYMLRKKND